ncbi:tannase/feruloyl esterase family alpha/beta hydrolase [Microbulbifer sp. SH-1]|uniref:tannase/feruloyl esterase family alpha/beta hydrolase n=1 Tax=Microbulbifer sp. SH-1 TaxID=2681547 RepID=UPI00140B326D|nr:tannase/feruloyl esterase family alpha/beta hydrolase [Microbulbifer sp. SH-1]QIL91267.1 tannase/feruloyl esterase family alpha/beta hydrolase [Microbulbifer sp. SH-1]
MNEKPLKSHSSISNLSLIGVGILLSAICLPTTADVKDDRFQIFKEECSGLEGKTIGSAIIDSADIIEKGDKIKRIFLIKKIVAPLDLCRIQATTTGTSEIKIEMWLPRDWNGKMLGQGGGGINGGLNNTESDLVKAVAKGYAGITSNLGHDGSLFSPGKWANGNNDKVADFGHRANHIVANAGKSIISEHYGKAPTRSYFQGCSGGGREALMAAQMYPQDYDGIIAGAPAGDMSGLFSAGLWNATREYRLPASGNFTDKAEALNAAVLEHCDEIDGVKDGIVSHPPACDFSPESLRCAEGNESDSCLTDAEVIAAKELYAGAQLGAQKVPFPGLPMGSELGWKTFITPGGLGAKRLAIPYFRWFVAGDSDWVIENFDVQKDYDKAKSKLGSTIDATNPDVSGFVERHGKLLMTHGWEDPAIPAGASIKYYSDLESEMGSEINDSARLFMMPGVGHCGGGPGPSTFDALSVLDMWVEEGTPPDQIVVSKFSDSDPEGKPVITRPICPWPKIAKYKGHGDSAVDTSFVCTSDEAGAGI